MRLARHPDHQFIAEECDQSALYRLIIDNRAKVLLGLKKVMHHKSIAVLNLPLG